MQRERRFGRACLGLCLATIWSACDADVTAARINGLAWLIHQQQGDGHFQSTGGLSIQPTAAALLAYRNAGMTQGYPHNAAAAWLAEAPAFSTDAISQKILALQPTGRDLTAPVNQLLAFRNNVDKTWGAYPHYQPSFPDTALASQAIYFADLGYTDASLTAGYADTSSMTVTYIASGALNADGGWPYMSKSLTSTALASETSRLIPTAHAVIALSHWSQRGLNVDVAITGGINWLKTKQLADSGYADDPAATTGNPYETALVLRAVQAAQAAGNAAAQTADIANATGFLLAKQNTDGSWNGDVLSTALALQSLPALVLADANQDGVPDAVTQVLTGAAPFDARQLANGNGQAVAGTNTAQSLAGATKSTPYSVTLTAAGTPTGFTLNGALPAGLIFNANTGQITGTPIAAGVYNLSYTASYIDGSTVTQVAELSVTAPSIPVPALPGIGMLVMAMLLTATTALINRRKPYHRSF